MDDVIWEVLIIRTNDTQIDFTSKELLEAIDLTKCKQRYSLVLFPKANRQNSVNDKKGKKNTRGKDHQNSNSSENKPKEGSTPYHIPPKITVSHVKNKKQCDICNIILPDQSFLTTMKDKVKITHKYIETSKKVTCKINTNTLLIIFMYNTLRSYQWDTNSTKIYDIMNLV